MHFLAGTLVHPISTQNPGSIIHVRIDYLINNDLLLQPIEIIENLVLQRIHQRKCN